MIWCDCGLGLWCDCGLGYKDELAFWAHKAAYPGQHDRPSAKGIPKLVIPARVWSLGLKAARAAREQETI